MKEPRGLVAGVLRWSVRAAAAMLAAAVAAQLLAGPGSLGAAGPLWPLEGPPAQRLAQLGLLLLLFTPHLRVLACLAGFWAAGEPGYAALSASVLGLLLTAVWIGH